MNASECERISDYLGLDFSDGPVRLQNYCTVAVLKGSWFEMGRQYAGQAHRSIRYHIAAQLGLYLRTWKSYKAMYAVLPEYEDMLNAFFPDYVEFVKGMTEGLHKAGFDIAYEDILLAYITLGPADKNEACAAASAFGSASADGKTVAGIHSDSPYVSNYTHPAIIAYPDNANAFVSFTGFTNGYMNDKGLVCMCTAGRAEAPGDVRKGNPICIGVLYNAAFSSNADEAIEKHIKYCRIGAGEICHYVDKDGHGGILETTGGHYAVRRPGDFGEKDFLCQSNCYLTEEMQSSGGNEPTNTRRYDSIFKYLSDHVGSITIDEVREALSNTSYYKKEEDRWVYEWKIATESWSPERRMPNRGPAMRRMFKPEEQKAWIIIGAEDAIVSKVPYANGAYAQINLTAQPEMLLGESYMLAQRAMWYANRDLDTELRNGMEGFIIKRRFGNFDEGKEAAYLGVNYQNVAMAASGDERLEFIGKAISQFNKAQVMFKSAMSGDPAKLILK